VTTAHLLVEHGLEHTAVITFFRQHQRYVDLSMSEKHRLLSISYNNLVDWHIQVQFDEILFVFNRSDPPKIVQTSKLSRHDSEHLRSEAFEQVSGQRPNPNVPALDDALIRTISFWKRNLAAELNNLPTNEELSSLFNTIMFIRAAEDNAVRMHRRDRSEESATLYETCRINADRSHFTDCLSATLRRYIPGNLPTYVLDEARIAIFNKLQNSTCKALIGDFYQNKFAPYRYDFSLMSKHALSRIYEHYVSILRIEPTEQLSFLPSIAQEKSERAFGSVYTPQFIARFFARYLREQMPPSTFRKIRSLDPACGSGIFLRTLLELQCDPPSDLTTDVIKSCFQRVNGYDKDENACQASRLSLALLHLVLVDDLPVTLNIHSAQILDLIESNAGLLRDYDAIIANPPFVSTTYQDPGLRKQLSDYMEEYSIGRVDLYLAFLRIAIDALKPGGYGLFVLPHNFLLAKNASKMREYLRGACWIRCLVDLKDVIVFSDVGAYVVLMIFQKRAIAALQEPSATLVKCQDWVGKALQYVLEGQQVESNLFSVYDVDQSFFSDSEWHILPPVEAGIKKRFDKLPILRDYFEVREGFITGADDVFLIPRSRIPKADRKIYVPYLSDREMGVYYVPGKTARYLFYPFDGSRRLTEDEVKRDFPDTWEYLCSHRRILRQRSPVMKGQLEWWMPVRPRKPEHMMRPKLVTPHLVLVPRFAFDKEGSYAVSHSPFLFPIERTGDDSLLRVFLAVLNSTPCFWHISSHSHSYQRGYARLESATLSSTPVPDPTTIDPAILKHLLRLVDKRIASTDLEDNQTCERELDQIVAGLYCLSAKERLGIGMEL
jgi:methylase of polypeptide subunit release factors